MKSVFEEYGHLWPQDVVAKVEPLLSRVMVLQFPRDKDQINKVKPQNVVVVTDKNLYDGNIQLFEVGFEHCVQSTRDDFANELLASSLMALRPESFMKDPIPFFFNGFQTSEMATASGRHFKVNFSSSGESSTILQELEKFLTKNNEMASLKDICVQAADEMISNAVFNAPMRPGGTRPNVRLPRNQDVFIPDSKYATLFSCFSENRVIIGCADPFGSLEKRPFLNHLRSVFAEVSASVRMTGESAGLGLKFLIENAANVYVLVNPGKQTLIACGFLLEGLKANAGASKHLHFSFR